MKHITFMASKPFLEFDVVDNQITNVINHNDFATRQLFDNIDYETVQSRLQIILGTDHKLPTILDNIDDYTNSFMPSVGIEVSHH